MLSITLLSLVCVTVVSAQAGQQQQQQQQQSLGAITPVGYNGWVYGYGFNAFPGINNGVHNGSVLPLDSSGRVI